MEAGEEEGEVGEARKVDLWVVLVVDRYDMYLNEIVVRGMDVLCRNFDSHQDVNGYVEVGSRSRRLPGGFAILASWS